jgi:hypothetical protein
MGRTFFEVENRLNFCESVIDMFTEKKNRHTEHKYTVQYEKEIHQSLTIIYSSFLLPLNLNILAQVSILVSYDVYAVSRIITTFRCFGMWPTQPTAIFNGLHGVISKKIELLMCRDFLSCLYEYYHKCMSYILSNFKGPHYL